MYNILVTGSEGQVGRAIFDHKSAINANFFFVKRSILDITDEAAIEEYLLINKINCVINCAAYTAVDLAESEVEICDAINAEACLSLADHCASLDILLVHLSSDYVYHPDTEEIITEESDTNPQSVYAQSKLKGEEYIQAVHPKHVILRTSWVYKEKGKNFVHTMLRLGKERNEINVVSDQIGSPTYADDIAQVILQIVSRIRSEKIPSLYGIFNFSNEGFTSWYEFATEIMKQKHLNCKVNPIPTSDYPTPAARPLNSRMSKSKIRSTFDLSLHDWKDSLKVCLDKIED